MEADIISKLKKFLTDHSSLAEENHVVYLLVEIRKLMDRVGCSEEKFQILRFYCDWILHTEKSRQLNVIASIVKGIEDSIMKGHKFSDGQFLPFGESHTKFIYKEELQKVMREFFLQHGLPLDIFSNEKWERFVLLLIQVLIDQPIILNGDKIKSLCFRPANQAANLEVELQDGRVGRFLNVF